MDRGRSPGPRRGRGPGTPPRSYRTTLQEAAEEVHLRFGTPLAAFEGDTAPFEHAHGALEQCLARELRPDEAGRPWIAIAVLVVLFAVVLGLVARVSTERAGWSRYLDAARSEPGWVVVDAGYRDGSWAIEGLRDPLARSAGEVAAGLGLRDLEIRHRWRPFHSLDPALVLDRARARLAPPDGVTLALVDGTLAATGRARHDWIGRLREARGLAGVERISTEGLEDLDRSALQEAARRTEAIEVRFDVGEIEPREEPGELLAALDELRAGAARTGTPVWIELRGDADPRGTAAANRRLSRDRAASVASWLEDRGVELPLVTRSAVRGTRDALDEERRAVRVRGPRDRSGRALGRGAPVIDAAVYERLLAALDLAVLERSDDGRLEAVGPVPDRLRTWVAEQSPPAPEGFLGTFLAALDEGEPTEGPTPSIPWSEVDGDGRELDLSAVHLRLPDRELVVVRAGSDPARDALRAVRSERLDAVRSRKQLERRDVLLHTIVHDMGNAVTAIAGTISLVQRLSTDEKLRSLATNAIDNGRRQRALVQEISALFAGDLERGEADADGVDLRETARTIAGEWAPTFEQAGVLLRTAGADGDELRVCGERTRTVRVLSNLLENAQRHAPAGTTVTVRIDAEPGTDPVVAVEDEGPGVPPASRERIFHRYDQGEGARGQSGLGLWFCRITVERWGGAIGCDASPSGGARFWFSLPRVA